MILRPYLIPPTNTDFVTVPYKIDRKPSVSDVFHGIEVDELDPLLICPHALITTIGGRPSSVHPRFSPTLPPAAPAVQDLSLAGAAEPAGVDTGADAHVHHASRAEPRAHGLILAGTVPVSTAVSTNCRGGPRFLRLRRCCPRRGALPVSRGPTRSFICVGIWWVVRGARRSHAACARTLRASSSQ